VRSAETGDRIVDLVVALPAVAPDARRAERVRTRAHAALARQRQSRDRERLADRLLTPIFVGTVSVLYLFVVIRAALALQ
jgi:hypothetical protein